MLFRFIALLAAVHAVAFALGAAALQSPYLLCAAVFMAVVGVAAVVWGRRRKGGATKP
jgi:hypothetical protein